MVNITQLSFKENVRQEIDFLELVSETIQLDKHHSGNSPVMVTCPFHNDTNPSLAIYHDHATCYGVCHQTWDVFAWIMHTKSVDFPEALKMAAQRTRLEFPSWSPAEIKEFKKAQDKEHILNLTSQFFHQELWAPDGQKALDYARGRGWSDETIRTSGLGFAANNKNLQAFLKSQEVDILLAKEVGLLRKDGSNFCANGNGYLESPDGYLVYPHNRSGNIEYMAARGITPDTKSHRNLPGTKHLYFNEKYNPKAKWTLIVEGQADAVSLAEWGFSAIALCGCSLQYFPIYQRETQFVLVPNNDGKTDIAQIAAVLGLYIKVLYPPHECKDINEYHAQGNGDKAEISDFLREPAITFDYLDILFEQISLASGQEQIQLRRQLFEHVARTDDPMLRFSLKQQITEQLVMPLREYDAMLKSISQEMVDPQSSGTEKARYVHEHNRTYEIKYSKDGAPVHVELANFCAEIKADVICDDGENAQREYQIGGIDINGRTLPTINVLAGEFGKLDWVPEHWGAGQIVRSGFGNKDKLREAIQALSPETQTDTRYTHTGWRKIGDHMVYLSTSGGIGNSSITAKLPDDLKDYQLPLVAEDPAAAMRLILQFIQLSKPEITYPLLAGVFLSPLAEITSIPFVLWLYGTTGTMKSTLAALLLNCFGPAFSSMHLSADWWSTANALEKLAFHAKDTLLVIDDYRPEADIKMRKQLESSASRIIRAVGNQSGRARMKRDLQFQKTFQPRGLILSTGELLPTGHSIAARSFSLELEKGDVDLEKLTSLQAQSHIFSHGMSGYISWLAPQWPTIQTTLPAKKNDYRNVFMQAKMHARLPENTAYLFVGLDMMLQYALEIGAISSSQKDQYRSEGQEAIKAAAVAQVKLTNDQKPTERYLSVLCTLLIQGKVGLLDAANPNKGLGANPKLSDQIHLIGVHDDENIYLMPGAVFNRISQFCRDENDLFPITESAIRKQLAEEEILLKVDETRLTVRKAIDGKQERLLCIPRAAVEPYAPLDIPEWDVSSR
jgi:DNA primase catalytic core